MFPLSDSIYSAAIFNCHNDSFFSVRGRQSYDVSHFMSKQTFQSAKHPTPTSFTYDDCTLPEWQCQPRVGGELTTKIRTMRTRILLAYECHVVLTTCLERLDEFTLGMLEGVKTYEREILGGTTPEARVNDHIAGCLPSLC